MPETWCYWHFLCMFASSRLIALCTPNCKSLWIKASAKWLNVNVSRHSGWSGLTLRRNRPGCTPELCQSGSWLGRAGKTFTSGCTVSSCSGERRLLCWNSQALRAEASARPRGGLLNSIFWRSCKENRLEPTTHITSPAELSERLEAWRNLLNGQTLGAEASA